MKNRFDELAEDIFTALYAEDQELGPPPPKPPAKDWFICVVSGMIDRYHSDPKPKPETTNPMFYIQDSRSYAGNSAIWWRTDGKGYTSDLTEAWRVNKEKAERICRSRSTDRMWPCHQIDAITQKHFDAQNFTRMKTQ